MPSHHAPGGERPDPELQPLVVDGNNVIGARPDGWWRDRPAAALRLLGRLQCYRAHTPREIALFLDVPQAGLPEGDHDGVTVRYADSGGPDAADRSILRFVEEHLGDPLQVVTSDRRLADDVRRHHALVTGAGTFLATLDEAGC